MFKIDSMDIFIDYDLICFEIYLNNNKYLLTSDYYIEERVFESNEIEFIEATETLEVKEIQNILSYVEKTYIKNEYIANKYLEIKRIVKEINLDKEKVKFYEHNERQHFIKIQLSENSFLEYEMNLRKDGVVLNNLSCIYFVEIIDGIKYKYTTVESELLNIIKEKVLNSNKYRLKKVLKQIK